MTRWLSSAAWFDTILPEIKRETISNQDLVRMRHAYFSKKQLTIS